MHGISSVTAVSTTARQVQRLDQHAGYCYGTRAAWTSEASLAHLRRPSHSLLTQPREGQPARIDLFSHNHNIHSLPLPVAQLPRFNLFERFGQQLYRSTAVPPKEAQSNTVNEPKIQVDHRSESQSLLWEFYENPERLDDIPGKIQPALRSLLAVGDYVAARELLEHLLEGNYSAVRSTSTSKVPSAFMLFDANRYAASEASEIKIATSQSAENVNTILASMLKQDFSNKLAIAPMSAILDLLIHHLHSYPTQWQSDLTTLQLLTRKPEYVSLKSLRLVISLLESLVTAAGGLQSKSVQKIYHNIMRIYLRYNKVDLAEQWMHAIEANSTSKSKRESLPPVKKEDFRKASPPILLATSYLSSLARSRPRGVAVDETLESNGISRTRKAMDLLERMKTGDTGSGSRSSSGRKLDIRAWTAAMSVAANDVESISSEDLLTLFGTLENIEADIRPNIVTFTVLLDGLNKRRDFEYSLHIFETVILPQLSRSEDQSHMCPDVHLLQSVVDAWVGYEDGSLDNAIRVVNFFAASSAQGPDSLISLPLYTKRSTSDAYAHLRNSIPLDTIFLNNIMSHLANAGYYSLVWRIWSVMEEQYGVLGDEVTLAILAKVAISISKISGRHNSMAWSTGDTFDAERNDGLLSFDNGQVSKQWQRDLVKGYWNGQAPHLAIRQIYWSMLEGNFPMIAIKVNESRPTKAESFFGLTTSLPRSDDHASHFVSRVNARSQALQWTHALHNLAALTDPSKAPEYPYLFPSQSNMHMLIALLGYFSISSEIPYVLQYMKYLNITPTRRTLCLALLAREESGAYAGQLREEKIWLVDWLGEGGVPTDEEVGAFRRQQH